MIPRYDLTLYGANSAFKKVAEWLPTVSNYENQTLGLGLPNDFGCMAALSHARRTVTNHAKPDPEYLKEKTQELYNIVLKTLGGNEFRLPGRFYSNFPDSDKHSIITALQSAGFNVNENDFIDIIQIARTVRNNNGTPKRSSFNPDQEFRHASLNCYDYDRLKSEMKDLAEAVGYGALEENCSTLMKIVREAAEGEMENGKPKPYPGRHLPFNKIMGRSSWRYQCLRLMDEILCTSQYHLDYNEMVTEIRKKAKEYNISGKSTKYKGMVDIDNIPISETSLKKYYVNLSELINVEHTHGKKKKYNRDVYEDGVRGHLYKKYKGDIRLRAFTVDISVQEAVHLREEIGVLRVKHFGDNKDYFAEHYPLVSMLGYMEELSLDDDAANLVNQLTGTDIATVNYKPSEFLALKNKVQQIIDSKMPVGVKKGDDWELLIPLSIKEDKDKWVLLAKEPDSPTLRLITPDIILHTIPSEIDELITYEWNAPDTDRLIGIGKLLKEEPYQVTLELTDAGIEDINSKDSVFFPLKPRTDRMSLMSFGRYSRGTRASFKVYINEDFLSELFRLDKTAKLISVEPMEINELYERYYEMRMGKKRIPLEDRPLSMKTLKEPKKGTKE